MTSKQAKDEIIKAFMMERGCSRLNAAGYAMHALVTEYNAIQARLGCKLTTVIVDSGQLMPTSPDYENTDIAHLAGN